MAPFEPLALMWKVVPPHMWAAFFVICLGVAATLQTAAFNWSWMITARLFPGACEVSFAPGSIQVSGQEWNDH
jgi:hypothetical protein